MLNRWHISFPPVFMGEGKSCLLRFSPYFVDPIIVGLESEGKPFICSTDLIGCINFANDFVVSGTSSSNLYGICESFYEKGLVFLIDSRIKMLCLKR